MPSGRRSASSADIFVALTHTSVDFLVKSVSVRNGAVDLSGPSSVNQFLSDFRDMNAAQALLPSLQANPQF